jgi:hypothetical protein
LSDQRASSCHVHSNAAAAVVVNKSRRNRNGKWREAKTFREGRGRSVFAVDDDGENRRR